MATEPILAIFEWAEGLPEADISATLRALNLNSEGSLAEQRYRLVRYHWHSQYRANVSWTQEDMASADPPLGGATVPHASNFPSTTSTSTDLGYTPPSVNVALPMPPNTSVDFSRSRPAPASNTTVSTISQTAHPGGITATSEAPSNRTSSPPFDSLLNQPTLVQLLQWQEFLNSTQHARGMSADELRNSTPPPFNDALSFMNHASFNTVPQPQIPGPQNAVMTIAPINATVAPTSAINSRTARLNQNPLGAGLDTMRNVFPTVPSNTLPFCSTTIAQPTPIPTAIHGGCNNNIAYPHDNSPMHAGEIIRKWKINFDGKRDNSAEEFLLV